MEETSVFEVSGTLQHVRVCRVRAGGGPQTSVAVALMRASAAEDRGLMTHSNGSGYLCTVKRSASRSQSLGYSVRKRSELTRAVLRSFFPTAEQTSLPRPQAH